MQKIAVILNLPWSLLGLFYGIFCCPTSIGTDRQALVIIMKVKRLWVSEIFLGQRVGGFTLGNTILLSNAADDNIYGHEIIHVKQFTKLPIIFPVLYLLEFVKNGYYDNRYEREAYQKSNKPVFGKGLK